MIGSLLRLSRLATDRSLTVPEASPPVPDESATPVATCTAPGLSFWGKSAWAG